MPRTPDTKRRLEYIPLDDIVRAPRNPNGHDIPGIAASIRRHGFVEPVIRDDRTGYLLGGHGRLDVLVDMRAAEEVAPAGITHDWRVPCILGWASASDAEAEALLLAMVNLTKHPVEDAHLLAQMLSDLAADPGGLAGTGYDDASLDLLFSQLAEDAPHAPTDTFAEWRGMPDYTNEDLRPECRTMVNFRTREDGDRFWREVLHFEDGYRAQLWWPEHDGFIGQTQEVEWVVDDGPADGTD